MHTRDSPSLAAGAHGSTYIRLPPKGAAGSPRTAGLAGVYNIIISVWLNDEAYVRCRLPQKYKEQMAKYKVKIQKEVYVGIRTFCTSVTVTLDPRVIL